MRFINGLLCRHFQHKIAYRQEPYYNRRWGQMATRSTAFCARCGLSYDGEVYERGAVGRLYHAARKLLTPWGLKHATSRLSDQMMSRITTKCEDCGKLDSRFGKPAGNHLTCDPIPF